MDGTGGSDQTSGLVVSEFYTDDQLRDFKRLGVCLRLGWDHGAHQDNPPYATDTDKDIIEEKPDDFVSCSNASAVAEATDNTQGHGLLGVVDEDLNSTARGHGFLGVMDEDLNSKHKTSDDLHGSGGNRVVLPNIFSIKLIVQHRGGGATTKKYVGFDVNVPVSQLKQEMQDMLRIPAECQRWDYRHREVSDSASLADINIKQNDTIQVKHRRTSTDQTE